MCRIGSGLGVHRRPEQGGPRLDEDTNMSATVYFLRSGDNADDQETAERLEALITSRGLLDFVKPKDFIAVKTHFGEEGAEGYVRPVYLRAVGAALKRRGATPFLTETSTLYRRRRTNAVDHTILAHEHGFTIEATGMPILMADGLLGDEEVKVEIPGRIYDHVHVAAMLAKVQGLVLVTHFTGHLVAGFGAALKNLGMGCTSRKAKLIQHSTATPSIKPDVCTGCQECMRWCPEEAISMDGDVAVIDPDVCIGCGECLAVCRFDAVYYNWKATHEDIQRKIAEHAWGVVRCVRERALYVTALKRITKDCDCMPGYEKIAPDLGFLVSTDPVAIDAAAIDLIEAEVGRPLGELAFDVPTRYQLIHAREIGFGSPDYDLVEVDDGGEPG